MGIPDMSSPAPPPKWKKQAKRWARTPGFEQKRLHLYKKERKAKKSKRARQRKAKRVKRINRRAKVAKKIAHPATISHKVNRRQLSVPKPVLPAKHAAKHARRLGRFVASSEHPVAPKLAKRSVGSVWGVGSG